MSDSAHVLVVEDEDATRRLLASYFESEGYQVTEAAEGSQVVDLVREHAIDLVLLDIRLPDIDGLELTKRLRSWSDVGIILVTAKKDEIDRIVGIELGADDYVTKPFNTRELFARAKNLIKRVRHSQSSKQVPDAERLEFQGWALDLNQHQLFAPDGNLVSLTEGEYQLLAALAANAPRILSRDQLLDTVSHKEWVPSDRTIDVMIARLRRKLEDDPNHPEFVKTIRGVGYTFACEIRRLPQA